MYCQAFDTKPSQTGQVARNGYHLHYQIHGTGPIKLCFILGMMQPMAAMKIIVDRIVALGKYSFLLLDNRGFGFSSGGAFGRFTTSELALDALSVLEHVGWTLNVNLSGGSLGGMIAQEMAASRPAYFRSLVLFCTWGQPAFPNFFSAISTWASLMKPRFTVENSVRGNLEFIYSDVEYLGRKDERFPSFVTNYDRLLATGVQNFTKPELGTVFGLVTAALSHNLTEQKCNIIKNLNVVLVHGQADKMINSRCSAMLAERIPGSKFIELPGKGHGIAEEAEDLFVSIMLESADA
jgi:pimeloyl-ACP methyl ester carboxylesterase